MRQKRNEVESQIGESRTMLNNHSSLIKTELRTEYEHKFKKNEFIEGDIEDKLVQKWREHDASESMDSPLEGLSLDIDTGFQQTHISNVPASSHLGSNSGRPEGATRKQGSSIPSNKYLKSSKKR